MLRDAPLWRSLLAAQVLLFLQLGTADVGAADRPKAGPPAAWVEPLEAPVSGSAPKDEVNGGTWFRLSDRQVRVVGGDPEAFSHYTRQIVNDAGLEGSSQVGIEFEPSYQKLTFHWIRIYRNGQWLDRLSIPQMKVIQREAELESQIYDGRLSAITFIEDLRVGDILDYAYTIRGSNPVLGRAFSDTFATEWSVGVQRMSVRLLWPTARHLNVRNHGAKLEPRTRKIGEYTEMVWERNDVRGLVDEGALPPWYDPWGWVQLSEYADWSEVAAWGRALFRSATGPLTPDIRAKVTEWKAQTPDPDEQALLAVRFVQDEIRYVGLEMGEGSHRPNRPDTVFHRRFGDCKDKALLLASLLRDLGFDATPALISTTSGAMLPKWLPTPLAFNHAVVVLKRGDRRLWIDATLSGQGGDLDHIQFPTYGNGLILEEGTKDLTPVLVTKPVEPTLVTKSTYTTSSFDRPTDLVVETRYLGTDADEMRAHLLETSRSDLGKNFTKFYAGTYTGVQASGLPEAKDDRRENALTVIERYSIPTFWTRTKTAGRRPSVDVYPLVLMGIVPKPVPNDRVMPVGLVFPRKVREVTEVVLPEDWEIEHATESIGDDWMRLEFRVSSAPKRFIATYDYETLRDGVPADKIAVHRRIRERLLDRLGYALGGSATSKGGELNWSAVILIGALSPIALSASIWMLRKRSLNVRAPLDPASSGLRGRLIVVGLLLILVLLRHGYALYDSRSVWSLEDWLARTSPDQDGYHAWWAPYLFVELLGNSLSLCFALVLISLFLARRRTFPRVLIWFLVFEGVYLLASAQLARFLPEMSQSAFDFLLATAWAIGPLAAFVPYLFLSDRARSTFVR